MRVLADAIQRAGGTDSAKLRMIAQTKNFVGVTGSITSMDKRGETRRRPETSGSKVCLRHNDLSGRHDTAGLVWCITGGWIPIAGRSFPGGNTPTARQPLARVREPIGEHRSMDTFVQQLINGLNVGAIYALMILGYTMVYGILRLINFAHDDVYMVGAFAGFYIAYAAGSLPVRRWLR